MTPSDAIAECHHSRRLARDRNLWDNAAPAWKEFQESGRDMHRRSLMLRLLSMLHPLQGKRILDLGCGEGSVARRVASAGAVVYAVDYSNKMLSLAQHAHGDVEISISYILCDTSRIPLRSESCDAIVSVFSMLSTCDAFGALQEAFRLCKRHARMHVSLFYPGVFRCAYRPNARDIGPRAFSVDDEDKEFLLRWELTGMARAFCTMAYFRSVSRYLSIGRAAGFSVTGATYWNSRGQERLNSPSGYPRVVDLVLLKP